MNKIIQSAIALLFIFSLSSYVQAITVTFNFTGECDDCAFSGNPGDVGFNPLNDGLTETVNATLSIVGLDEINGMIGNSGAGTVVFSYGGSSLLNPFTMADPYTFSNGLMTNGQIASGFEFRISSSVNYADPSNPVNFDFPNFCTALGEQVLRPGSCDFIGDITFLLNDAGNWNISGTQPEDIGTNGQFSVVPIPGAIVLFASGFIGLIGFARRKKA